MAANFIVVPEAQDDLAAIYDWYEAQRPGLGEDFLDCFDACLERIRRMPEFYGIAFETYRRAARPRYLFIRRSAIGDVLIVDQAECVDRHLIHLAGQTAERPPQLDEVTTSEPRPRKTNRSRCRF